MATVFVYYNLTKKCWSIRAEDGPHKGRVIAHADEVLLSDCTFKVSEAGRQRVLATRCKNVHAGIRGTLNAYAGMLHSLSKLADAEFDEPATFVTYNPYKYETFVTVSWHRPVHAASTVYLTNQRQVLAQHTN